MPPGLCRRRSVAALELREPPRSSPFDPLDDEPRSAPPGPASVSSHAQRDLLLSRNATNGLDTPLATGIAISSAPTSCATPEKHDR